MTQPYQLAPVPLFRVQDNNNRPLAGGQVFTYQAGTTTPQASYPSPSSGSPNANPVILNARGEAAIWLDPALTYKVNVLDSGGNQIPGYPVDNIPGGTNLTQAGLGLILYPRTAAEVTAAVVPSAFAYPPGDVRRYGADPSGVSASDVAIAQAISVAAVSGGVVTFAQGTAYAHASPITLKSNVVLSGYASSLTYSGSAQQITSPQTGVLTNAGILGLTLNAGSAATKIIELWSPYSCTFKDLYMTSTGTTDVVLDIQVNTSGATNPEGDWNAVFNMFENGTHQGSCGTFVRLQGNGPAGGAPVAVVSLNNFLNWQQAGAANTFVRGIDFVKFCDTNHFSGITRVVLASVVNTAAIGAYYNSAGPTQNFGVYSNSFDILAVDTFGNPAGDARIALYMGLTKDNKIRLANGPAAAGGTFVIAPGASPPNYDVTLIESNGNFSQQSLWGQTLGVGGTALSNAVLNVTSGPAGLTSGSSQYGANLTIATTSGGGATLAAGAAGQANPLSGSTLTYALGFYAPGNVLTGSTVTLNAGYYAADTSGGGINAGFVSNVAAGAGKFNFYGSGTAPSTLGGPLGVNGVTSPPAQLTGWGSPTGNSVQNNYPGATATLAQTSAAVAQIIATLKAMGVFGA